MRALYRIAKPRENGPESVRLVVLAISACFLLIACGATPTPTSTSLPRSLPAEVKAGTRIVAIDRLTGQPERYHGSQILTGGYLVLDKYGYALFPTADDYADWNVDARIMIAKLPPDMRRRWEKYERAYFQVAGEFDSTCRMFEEFDKGKSKEKPVTYGKTEEFRRCIDGAASSSYIENASYIKFIGQEPVAIAESHPHYWNEFAWQKGKWRHHETIRRSVRRFLTAVEEGDKSRVFGAFGPDAPPALRHDLEMPGSVASERLLIGSDSLRALLQKKEQPSFRNGLLIGAERAPSSRGDDAGNADHALACICKDLACDGDWRPTWFQGVFANDPYICIGLNRKGAAWDIDFWPYLSPDRDYAAINWSGG